MENTIESRVNRMRIKVAQREFLTNKVKTLIREGCSYEKISKELNISEASCRQIRKEIEDET